MSAAPRDFAAELRAARDDGDWEASARIWDERIAAAVEADEAILSDIHLAYAAPKLLAALEAICADHAMASIGGPLIEQARQAILEARGAS